MQLIGMLDSPYVRRVAISLKMMRIPFEHRSLSVFRDFAAFQAINPIVKAPTLVCDDGTVLSDSTLILNYVQNLAPGGNTLLPSDPTDFRRALHVIGVALAACEKSVQLYYEFNIRPPEARYQPWIDRVRSQMIAAYGLLEAAALRAAPWFLEQGPLQPDVTAAVAFRFTREMTPEGLAGHSFPALTALSARAENLPEFLTTPPA